MRKGIDHLNPKDFLISPIWQPVDDLEDPDMEVTPFQGENFNLEGMYLIATKFTFADGSEWEGYIRYSWGTPIEMALAFSNNRFRSFAIERNVETEEGHREFARGFSKKYDDVFPIEFQSKVKLFLQSTVY